MSGSPVPGASDGHPLPPLSVLVVDDMPAIREMLKRMLLKLGVQGEIQEAGDGLEAWEILQKQPYDLVVCDINMPRLNGLELLRRLRAHPRYETTPFLMITGEVSEDIVAASAESEVDDYLLKPFRLETLNHRLKTILARHRQPSPGESLFRKAKKLLAQGNPEAALKILERLSSPPYPLQAKVFNLMGKCFQALGSLGEAAVCFDQALELNPKYLKAYLNLAKVMESQGNLSAARRYLEEVNQLSPPNRERLFQLGRLCLREGLVEQARRYLTQACCRDLQLNHPKEAQEVARLFLEAGLEDLAAQVLTEALAQSPREISLYLQLAQVFRLQKKIEEAQDICLRGLAVDPHNHHLHFELGLLWFDLGEKDKAREAISHALKLWPHFPEARDFFEKNFVPAEEASP